jgi:protein O-GlcNAc transferase
MPRHVAALVLLVAAVAGAAAYNAYATDREYGRLIALGDHAVAEDQPFRALEAYSGAIALRPESMLAHLKRGVVYRQRGELDAALADLWRAAQLDATATRALESLGDAYMTLGRFDRAAARFQAHVALDDRSARVWYKLGLAWYRDNRAAEAIEPLHRAVALDKSMAEAHALLGLCHRDLGDHTRARSALETATQLAPGLIAPREALAALHLAAGESARAIDQLEALAALDPTQPERLVALGLAHARLRRHDAAVLTLTRAVERFPESPHVWAALGHVWLDAAELRGEGGALKKAFEALSTAASHPDVTSEALTDLGRASLLAGDPAGAEHWLRLALARLPIHADAFLHLGTLAARGGRPQEARDAWVRYATLLDESASLAPVAAQIASLSLRLGDPHVALRWIDRAVDEIGATPALATLRRRAEAALPLPLGTGIQPVP